MSKKKQPASQSDGVPAGGVHFYPAQSPPTQVEILLMEISEQLRIISTQLSDLPKLTATEIKR